MKYAYVKIQKMNKQLTLFTETTHLESDCWFSGTPDIPDPYDGEYWQYNTELLHDKQSVLFHGELGYNGELALLKKIGEAACESQ